MSEFTPVPHAAIVSRRQMDDHSPGRYLQLGAEGTPRWTTDPEAATSFESMREAARAAAHLPAAICAYGMPREVELMASRDLN